MTKSKINKKMRILGWLVHLYTASGLAIASFMAIAIINGEPKDFALAFLLMIAATVVDSTDGFLARAVNVKKHVPSFDGRKLDDIVDFVTYTCLPLLLIWRAELLNGSLNIVLIVCLMASAYGFCQTNIKTGDGYFLGFPSYWNALAIYLYLLQPSSGVSAFVLIFWAIMTFVPLKYLYPSQPGRLNRWTSIFASIWGIELIWIVARLWRSGGDIKTTNTATLVSLIFPAYYLVASWVVSYKLRQK